MVPVALIFAMLLMCSDSSAKPLDLRLVVDEEKCWTGAFWGLLKYLMHSERAGGLRHIQQFSYDGHKKQQSAEVGIRGLGAWRRTGRSRGAVHGDRPNQQTSHPHRNRLVLLFEIPMESISLSTCCWDSLAYEFHPGLESALPSMTLRDCGTAPLVSTLRICPYLTTLTLNYTGIAHGSKPFDAEALGIALGHAPSLEDVNICFDFTKPREARWLRGNIGTLKNLVRLQTLAIPTQMLLGWVLDTPRLHLRDVFPASLRELRLRHDGSDRSWFKYCWKQSHSPISEYLNWRADKRSSNIGVALNRIYIHQRDSWLDFAVVKELQQKCDLLGIPIEFR
jgi:hypothetical protein